ncbi:MAG: hypothetical protein ACD_58C00324G0003 [uncultured bacterium]|nr:MAG: hypothetical protein ACD_58C00324G0003 [uncultured bacterium]
MTLKNKTITVIIITVLIFGLAILIWAQKTGKISIFGAENLSRITVQIKNLVDWNKGEFANTKIEGDSLKLSASSTNNTNNGGSSNTTTKTINDLAIAMILKNAPKGNCSALAPNDWAIVSDDYGLEAGLTSPDLTTFASWTVPWSLKSMLQGFGHPELIEEENFLKVSLCVSNFANRSAATYKVASLEECSNGGDYKNVTLGSAISKANGYYVRDYSLTNLALNKELKGQAIYKNFSSGDVILYLLRMGSTVKSDWEKSGALAISSAVSIKCSVNTTGVATNSGKPSGINRTKDDPEISLSDKWQEATMGYENVYNPATGQHWEAPTSSYWETGPQGAGYYYQNGNDLTKLSRGFGY